jgi:hypothetical protein
MDEMQGWIPGDLSTKITKFITILKNGTIVHNDMSTDTPLPTSSSSSSTTTTTSNNNTTNTNNNTNNNKNNNNNNNAAATVQMKTKDKKNI